MGRLPDSFAGRPITSRVPYIMGASATLTSAQGQHTFLSSLFTHNANRAFEIHRVLFRGRSAAYGDLALTLANVQIFDFTRNQNLLKVPTPPANLIVGSAIKAWEWAQPYYLERAEGFAVTLDAQPFPAEIASIVIQVAFQGFLVIDSPVTDRRG